MRPVYKYYHGVLSKEECEYLIQHAEADFKAAKVGNGIGKPNAIVRRGSVAWISSESKEECNNIIRRLVDLMFYESEFTHGQKLNQVEPVQVAKYGMLDHYNKHIDVGSDGPYRVLSGVVELSNPKDYYGGGLDIFYARGKESIPLKQGSVVLFPSILTHRAKPVFWGSRYSLSLWGCREQTNTGCTNGS